MTQEEINARFAQINALPAETMTPAEEKSYAAAVAMDDGSAVPLDEFRKGLEEYSGRLVLRIPRSLHRLLKQEAEIEGVSLNQYMLYKLAR